MALLTVDTVAQYVSDLGDKVSKAGQRVFPAGAVLKATEIQGGNLNYAFCVKSAEGPCVFVKQAPDFVKVLGPDAKLHKERMALEVRAYKEWESFLGGGASAAKYLPNVYHFDEGSMVVVMEFLGSYQLLQDALVAGAADERVAAGLGEWMGLTHGKTHVSKVPADTAASLTADFENGTLRGLQLEYVFSKAFREADRAADLRADDAFMREVEQIKGKYKGEEKSNLALCHGDFHPGSVMVDHDPQRADVVKVIDPEFVVYGPPGLDVGSLLSGYALTCIQHVHTGTGKAAAVAAAAGKVWESYDRAAQDAGITPDMTRAIGEDAAGFAGCEIARTALGFAGVRGISCEDPAVKGKAEAEALRLAHRCVMGRRDAGVAVLLDALREMAK